MAAMLLERQREMLADELRSRNTAFLVKPWPPLISFSLAQRAGKTLDSSLRAWIGSEHNSNGWRANLPVLLEEGEPKRYQSRFGAGDGIRTRDINLGKVALYQLSYSRRGGITILA